MSTEPSWVSVAVTPSPADRQVDDMVADPATYFIRSRQEAKREARRYVAQRLRYARPA
ncbi:hypothetical protein SAMN05443575_2529 [Jatrophihabitans endophyticus]|uniref:Uncharacterized protein n=1 Tax=Jatrophihabitans endophyticus TaxID=1206085 RepID=A0A1M5LS19_9ACTN|nr:hypothetical protein [Jatrophihabitans endophyticus]SHG67811.1 hypothetical protein SAMN05443575_2529 [Jatrophihabitans endophyticus]